MNTKQVRNYTRINYVYLYDSYVIRGAITIENYLNFYYYFSKLKAKLTFILNS